MNAKPVVAFDVVQDDVQAAYDYFAERTREGGDRFLRRYFETTDRIAANAWTFAV